MVVLVGYASANGSTRQIADQVASGLREHGYQVEVAPMSQVQDPGRYGALVLGSAIHDGRWLPEATAFMDRSLGVLAGRPVWLFSVGMAAALPRPMQAMARNYEPKEIAGYRDAIAPVGHRLFSGVIRPEHLDRGGRLRFKALGCRYGDYRDRAAIDAYAEQIARHLAGTQAGTRMQTHRR